MSARVFLLARLYHWHRVDPELFRSAQMYRGHVATLLRHHAIASVINLRGANPGAGWYCREAATCNELDVSHHDCRMNSRRLPSREFLLELLDLYESAPRPLLIKCSGGTDRTGLAALIYLLQRFGIDALPRARRQLGTFPYLHLPRRHQQWIRRFPDFVDQTRIRGSFADWTRNVYAPERFASWLEAKDLAGSWER